MVGPPLNTMKFLCSYGGKILPRFPDGKLRYQGGQTRVLAVHRSISFAELLMKLGELCGAAVSLRCKLPTEDLDALVSITSDEDLKNLVEEYDRISSSLKIRAFLSLPKSTTTNNKKGVISPPPHAPTTTTTTDSSSASASASSSSPKSHSPPAVTSRNSGHYSSSRFPVAVAADRCIRHIPRPINYDKSVAGKVNFGNVNPATAGIYLIHNGNHWQ